MKVSVDQAVKVVGEAEVGWVFEEVSEGRSTGLRVVFRLSFLGERWGERGFHTQNARLAESKMQLGHWTEALIMGRQAGVLYSRINNCRFRSDSYSY